MNDDPYHIEEFQYSNVHEFLNDVFEDSKSEPTEFEIKKAKKRYWKRYNKELKRKQRRVKKYLQLTLDRTEYEKLEKRAKESKVNIYRLIKDQLFSDGESPFYFYAKSEFHSLLFETLNALEDLRDGYLNDAEFYQESLKRLEDGIHALEKHLSGKEK